MSLTLGIYDVFSYMLPGSVYLIIIFHQFNWAKNILQNQIQLGWIVAFLGLSYVTGILFDYLAVVLWYRFFATKNLHLSELEKFKRNNPNLEIRFTDKQWAVLQSYASLHSNENTHTDRYATQKIMLRNISFGLLILTFIHLFLFFTNQYSELNLIVFLGAFFLSIISGKSAQKFDHWMVSKIYENFAALAIEPKDFVRTIVKSNKPKNKR